VRPGSRFYVSQNSLLYKWRNFIVATEHAVTKWVVRFAPIKAADILREESFLRADFYIDFSSATDLNHQFQVEDWLNQISMWYSYKIIHLLYSVCLYNIPGYTILAINSSWWPTISFFNHQTLLYIELKLLHLWWDSSGISNSPISFRKSSNPVVRELSQCHEPIIGVIAASAILTMKKQIEILLHQMMRDAVIRSEAQKSALIWVVRSYVPVPLYPRN